MALKGRWLSNVFAVVIGIVICLVIIEVGGAAYFYRQHGRIVYLNPGRPAAAAAPAGVLAYKQRLHPYFGFTGQYSETFSSGLGTFYTNSLGFLQREQVRIPHVPAADDFIVAVFGGSVAANLVSAPQGGLQLRPALQALPELKTRRVVVLNMAQGAGKQPQQLLELSYLVAAGQRIDLALNLDGFNEFALGYENYKAGLSPILPAGSIIGALAQEIAPPSTGGAEYYEVAYEVSTAKRNIARRTELAEDARCGTAYLIHRALITRNAIRLKKYLERYESAINSPDGWIARKKALGLDMAVETAENGVIGDLFDLWLRSSEQMHAMSLSNHFGYLHVVQPVQYFSGKTFTENEKRNAGSLVSGHPDVIGAVAGYELVVKRKALLDRHGIISAIPLYDRIPGDIYMDCCHFNALGETMLAEFVATQVSGWLAADAASGARGLRK